VKVIRSEACITQHKLMVCMLELKESVKREKKKLRVSVGSGGLRMLICKEIFVRRCTLDGWT
jgi:hypothetical protein